MLYVINGSGIKFDGKYYPEGSLIELDEKQAAPLSHLLQAKAITVKQTGEQTGKQPDATGKETGKQPDATGKVVGENAGKPDGKKRNN